jgi:hypothetical protein
MKYMLIICGDESVQLSQEEGAEVESSAQSWAAEMGSRGIRLDGNRLSPVSDATTVRVRGGEVLCSVTVRSPRQRSKSAATT